MRFDASKWVKSKFEYRNVGRNELAICCPMCMDKRFRLYICTDPNKISKGGLLFACYCHNDQKPYSLADIYSAIENVGIEDAREIIEGRGDGISYSEIDKIYEMFFEEEKQDKDTIVNSKKPIFFPKDYVKLYGLNDEEWNSIAPEYIKKRKVTKNMCDIYMLGYTKHGLNLWSNRLIIPIIMDGEFITYQGRSMYDTNDKKYLFKKIPEENNIKIGDCLYNIDNIDKNIPYIILVEGVFDVWAIKKAGYNNCIASFGKHLTDKGLNKIIGSFNEIFILWDKDAKVEIEKLYKKLYGFLNIYIINLEGKDPDDSSKDEIVHAIESRKSYSDILDFIKMEEMLL